MGGATGNEQRTQSEQRPCAEPERVNGAARPPVPAFHDVHGAWTLRSHRGFHPIPDAFDGIARQFCVGCYGASSATPGVVLHLVPLLPQGLKVRGWEALSARDPNLTHAAIPRQHPVPCRIQRARPDLGSGGQAARSQCQGAVVRR